MAVDKIFTTRFPNESFSGADMLATCNIPINGQVFTATLGSIQTITYSIHGDRKPVRSISSVNVKDYVSGARTIAGSLIFTVFDKHCFYKVLEEVSSTYGQKIPNNYFMVDELPPFDVTISMANEHGITGRIVLYGIRLVNEGQVMSINDVYTENTYQYVATDIEYLDSIDNYKALKNKRASSAIVQKSEVPETSNIIKLTRSIKASAHKPKIVIKAYRSPGKKADGSYFYGSAKIKIEKHKDDKNDYSLYVDQIKQKLENNSSVFVSCAIGEHAAILKDANGNNVVTEIFWIYYPQKDDFINPNSSIYVKNIYDNSATIVFAKNTFQKYILNNKEYFLNDAEKTGELKLTLASNTSYTITLVAGGSNGSFNTSKSFKTMTTHYVKDEMGKILSNSFEDLKDFIDKSDLKNSNAIYYRYTQLNKINELLQSLATQIVSNYTILQNDNIKIGFNKNKITMPKEVESVNIFRVAGDKKIMLYSKFELKTSQDQTKYIDFKEKQGFVYLIQCKLKNKLYLYDYYFSLLSSQSQEYINSIKSQLKSELDYAASFSVIDDFCAEHGVTYTLADFVVKVPDISLNKTNKIIYSNSEDPFYLFDGIKSSDYLEYNYNVTVIPYVIIFNMIDSEIDTSKAVILLNTINNSKTFLTIEAVNKNDV